MKSNINVLVNKVLLEGKRPNKFTKEDIMTDEQMRKLLKPECIQQGEDFVCNDLGYDKEADKVLKSKR